MKKRLISLLLVSTLAMLMLVGCNENVDEQFKGKSKAEIISMYNELDTAYKTLDTSYNDLYTLYNGIQSENSPTPAIGITGDGTGRFTFNSFDSKIIFPTTFQYPDSTQVAADGLVNIVTNVTIQPGTNWITKLNGSTLELEHSSGISGTIKIGGQNYMYSAEELQTQVLSQWFIGLPPSNITYSNISVGGNAYGCQALTPTIIDSEDAYLRCGMFAEGNYSVTYVFVYRGTKDVNKDESITNLLNSISINGIDVIVEQ